MYAVGMPEEARDYYAYSTLLIAVPTGIKVFGWLACLGNATLTSTGMLNVEVLGFLDYFVVGGVTGVVLGNAGLDLVLHDAYYVVGHFHLVMGSAVSSLVIPAMVVLYAL